MHATRELIRFRTFSMALRGLVCAFWLFGGETAIWNGDHGVWCSVFLDEGVCEPLNNKYFLKNDEGLEYLLTTVDSCTCFRNT